MSVAGLKCSRGLHRTHRTELDSSQVYTFDRTETVTVKWRGPARTGCHQHLPFFAFSRFFPPLSSAPPASSTGPTVTSFAGSAAAAASPPPSGAPKRRATPATVSTSHTSSDPLEPPTASNDGAEAQKARLKTAPTCGREEWGSRGSSSGPRSAARGARHRARTRREAGLGAAAAAGGAGGARLQVLLPDLCRAPLPRVPQLDLLVRRARG